MAEAHLRPESKIFSQIFRKETAAVIQAFERKEIEIDHYYFAASGDTPLVWAVITNNLELAKYLLEHGANPNFRQARYHTTPLHVAARRGLNEMVLLLLKHGADKTIVEKHGLTPGQFVTFTRCKAVHSLTEEVQKELGVDKDTGAYREIITEADIKFWGKYGPPKKLTREEEEAERKRDKAILAELKKKKGAATGKK